MKNKERKEIAKKIASIELSLGDNPTEDEKFKAESAIMTLTSRISNMDDLFIIDEMVQEILTNKK
jgi:hypothetical protein